MRLGNPLLVWMVEFLANLVPGKGKYNCELSNGGSGSNSNYFNEKKMEEEHEKFIVITLRITEVIEAFTSVHYILESYMKLPKQV